ncbi:MFS transporter [Gulosibacter molinativorax]|uniref:MFS transporter n=1 Tax=Gulosibacter molinativorax TaxID=256821 RepID=A0ABT7CB27_9MICO|nr:MFS transporter [Gulosibacter molinativorax]QUY63549.1 Hypotetical protein [Gulosibacter molinativorax]
MVSDVTESQGRGNGVDRGGRLTSLQGAVALAAAMGVGRFVYTPALGAMTAQGAIEAETGALLASANYLGYLLGALIMLVGRRLQQPWPFRTSFLLLAITLALMTLPSTAVWFVARILAGLASAFIFVSVAQAVASRRDEGVDPGVVYAGLGAGVMFTGVVGGIAGEQPWQTQWWVAFGFLILALAATWRFNPAPKPVLRVAEPSTESGGHELDTSRLEPKRPRLRASWLLLLWSYGLLGAGYIILGTFLVVQVDEEIGGGLGPWFWAVTGLVAAPSTVIWRKIADRVTPSLAFGLTLVLQVLAGLLPVLVGGIVATVIAAALFGFTFIAAVMLATGMINLGVKGEPAKLTALYSALQLAGPLAVMPIIGSGYSGAFLVSAAINGVAMLLAFGLAWLQRGTGRAAAK